MAKLQELAAGDSPRSDAVGATDEINQDATGPVSVPRLMQVYIEAAYGAFEIWKEETKAVILNARKDPQKLRSILVPYSEFQAAGLRAALRRMLPFILAQAGPMAERAKALGLAKVAEAQAEVEGRAQENLEQVAGEVQAEAETAAGDVEAQPQAQGHEQMGGFENPLADGNLDLSGRVHQSQ